MAEAVIIKKKQRGHLSSAQKPKRNKQINQTWDYQQERPQSRQNDGSTKKSRIRMGRLHTNQSTSHISYTGTQQQRKVRFDGGTGDENFIHESFSKQAQVARQNLSQISRNQEQDSHSNLRVERSSSATNNRGVSRRASVQMHNRQKSQQNSEPGNSEVNNSDAMSNFSYRSRQSSRGGSKKHRGAKRRKSHRVTVFSGTEHHSLPRRQINLTASHKELPAGRPYDEPTEYRALNRASNDQLGSLISDLSGRIPTFGYPLITYSPGQQESALTDASVWKHAIVTNGRAIKDKSQEEFKMVSTAQLKLDLTAKFDKAVANAASRGLKNNNKVFNQNQAAVEYPAGVKYHMYDHVMKDMKLNQKNHWHHIFSLMGVQAGQQQNIVSEILESYHKQNDNMDRVYEKFQKGLPVEQTDLKDDVSQQSSRMNLNFSTALNAHSKASNLQKSRFSNLRSVNNRSTTNRSGILSNTKGLHGSFKSDAPRIFINGNSEKHFHERQPAADLKISNAKELMDFILKQNVKREALQKQRRENENDLKSLRAKFSSVGPKSPEVNVQVLNLQVNQANNYQKPGRKVVIRSSTFYKPNQNAAGSQHKPKRSASGSIIEESPYQTDGIFDIQKPTLMHTKTEEPGQIYSSRRLNRNAESTPNMNLSEKLVDCLTDQQKVSDGSKSRAGDSVENSPQPKEPVKRTVVKSGSLKKFTQARIKHEPLKISQHERFVPPPEDVQGNFYQVLSSANKNRPELISNHQSNQSTRKMRRSISTKILPEENNAQKDQFKEAFNEVDQIVTENINTIENETMTDSKQKEAMNEVQNDAQNVYKEIEQERKPQDPAAYRLDQATLASSPSVDYLLMPQSTGLTASLISKSVMNAQDMQSHHFTPQYQLKRHEINAISSNNTFIKEKRDEVLRTLQNLYTQDGNKTTAYNASLKHANRQKVMKTSPRQPELRISLDSAIKMRDIKKIEERNQVLIESVRRNINKIDQIVNRINVAERSRSREGNRAASLTDPIAMASRLIGMQASKGASTNRTLKQKIDENVQRKKSMGVHSRTPGLVSQPWSNTDANVSKESIQGFILGKSVKPIPLTNTANSSQNFHAQKQKKRALRSVKYLTKEKILQAKNQYLDRQLKESLNEKRTSTEASSVATLIAVGNGAEERSSHENVSQSQQWVDKHQPQARLDRKQRIVEKQIEQLGERRLELHKKKRAIQMPVTTTNILPESETNSVHKATGASSVLMPAKSALYLRKSVNGFLDQNPLLSNARVYEPVLQQKRFEESAKKPSDASAQN